MDRFNLPRLNINSQRLSSVGTEKQEPSLSPTKISPSKRNRLKDFKEKFIAAANHQIKNGKLDQKEQDMLWRLSQSSDGSHVSLEGFTSREVANFFKSLPDSIRKMIQEATYASVTLPKGEGFNDRGLNVFGLFKGGSQIHMKEQNNKEPNSALLPKIGNKNSTENPKLNPEFALILKAMRRREY